MMLGHMMLYLMLFGKACKADSFKDILSDIESKYDKFYRFGNYSNPIDKFIAYRENLDFKDAYFFLTKSIDKKNEIDI